LPCSPAQSRQFNRSKRARGPYLQGYIGLIMFTTEL